MSSPNPRASLLSGLRTGGVRTAAVDGPSNSFSQQQNMNVQSHHHALQLQLMQLEILRLQNLQAQKYQADLLAEAHRQLLSHNNSSSSHSRPFNPPATAGPTNHSFDLRAATVSAQMRRALDNSKSSFDSNNLPMSAALGGKFGSRTPSSSPPKLDSDLDSNATTVISGGTPLGTPPISNNTAPSTPSKSDTATSWRRGGNNNSVLSGNNRSPSVKVTPPPLPDRNSPPLHITKSRPLPLRFSPAVSQPLPVVALDGSPTDPIISSSRADDGYSSSSSKSLSSPTTPRSASSNDLPLSPREEATKKLYEGLGIGRPTSTSVLIETPPPSSLSLVNHRLVSQPMRQPRGPPSGTDELGPHNFATRLRRKAIGGLGAALLSARERREVVEAF